MLAYAVINHFAGEPNNIDCAFRIRNMIEGMVGAMDMIQEKNIKGGALTLVNMQIRKTETEIILLN
ncbi:MAG: hypothetical protein M3R27_15900 [Bacteroidota bacterium]|nr:hypothetical protein [Bacteroidota bacterium]